MKPSLGKFPFASILLVYVAWMGYQFYDFHFSTEGQVESHKGRLIAVQTEVQGLKKKLVEGKKFIESLEAKKREIQSAVKQLEEFQVTLSDNLDVPSLLKMLILEAKRTGVRVERVEPGMRAQKKYYLEQEFKMNVTGTFAQVVHYFQRIAQLQRILRVEEFSMKPVIGTNLSGNVLDSKLSIRAYQYTVSNEDQVAKGVKK